MNIFITEAQEKDVKDIAHIHQKTWNSTYKGIIPNQYFTSLKPTHFVDRWTDYFKEKNDRNKTVLLAFSDQKLIGFLAGGPERTKQFSSYPHEIYAIYIDQPFQRKGVGNQLFIEFSKWVHIQGENSCMVWVLENSPFLQFYPKIGAVSLASSKEIFFSTPEPFTIVAFGWPHLNNENRF